MTDLERQGFDRLLNDAQTPLAELLAAVRATPYDLPLRVRTSAGTELEIVDKNGYGICYFSGDDSDKALATFLVAAANTCAAPANVTSPQNEVSVLMLDEAQSMFKKLENDLLNWVRNKADREYTAATIAKFGQRVIEHLKQAAALPAPAATSISGGADKEKIEAIRARLAATPGLPWAVSKKEQCVWSPATEQYIGTEGTLADPEIAFIVNAGEDIAYLLSLLAAAPASVTSPVEPAAIAESTHCLNCDYANRTADFGPKCPECGSQDLERWEADSASFEGVVPNEVLEALLFRAAAAHEGPYSVEILGNRTRWFKTNGGRNILRQLASEYDLHELKAEYAQLNRATDAYMAMADPQTIASLAKELLAARAALTSSLGGAETTGWVPVGERLPAEDEAVLIYGRDRFADLWHVEIASYRPNQVAGMAWQTQMRGWLASHMVASWQSKPAAPHE